MEVEDLDTIWTFIGGWTWWLFWGWRGWLIQWWFRGWGCDFDIVDCDGVWGPIVGWNTGLGLVL